MDEEQVAEKKLYRRRMVKPARFAVKELQKSYVGRAMRLALPLLRESEATKKSNYEKAVNRISLDRRRIAAQLQHDGQITGLEYRNIHRCPPDGALVAPYPRTCRRHFICPFCWQRILVEPFASRLLPVVLKKSNRELVLPGLALGDLAVELLVEEWVVPVSSVEEGADVIRESTKQHNLRIPSYAKGSHSLITVIPSPDTWLVRRKLFTLSAAKDVAKPRRRNPHQVNYRDIKTLHESQDELIRLAATACAYPLGFILEHPDPEFNPLVEFLKAKEGAKHSRLRAMGGIFSGNCDPRLIGREEGAE